jgi:hypothetical protein
MSTWKYNRMYAHQAAPAEKIVDETIPARIDTLLNNGMINDWEKNFLGSIKAGYEKYKSLTVGQNNTFVGIEKRYDASAIAARESWKSNYDAEKAANWKAMMDYYVKTPYYRGATDKYLKDNAYIPTEAEYKAVCENKYSMRMLKNLTIPAKFKDGALVVYKRYGSYKLATVVSTGEVRDWTKGSRIYSIMVVGESAVNEAYEKELLYYREGLLKKLEKPGTDDETPF